MGCSVLVSGAEGFEALARFFPPAAAPAAAFAFAAAVGNISCASTHPARRTTSGSVKPSIRCSSL